MDKLIEKRNKLIEEKMNELCEDYTGLLIGKNDIYFDFNTDDECYIYISNMGLMEDEDDILDDAKAVFGRLGVEADFEWDYDCGDEYSQACMLEINIKDPTKNELNKDEKFQLINDLENMAYAMNEDGIIPDENMEELSNNLRDLRLAIEFEGGQR